jgi:uncharacterized membrane protein YozB (DUF420 family)
MTLSVFPSINAGLNLTAAVLLAMGFYFVKTGRVNAHRAAMGAAFLTSILFLVSYLYYHAHAGSKPYTGTGYLRTIYFSILISHTILAALIVPLILATLTFALRGRIEKHRAWAKWTWPTWMYVSVTGVVIYLMLYW